MICNGAHKPGAVYRFTILTLLLVQVSGVSRLACASTFEITGPGSADPNAPQNDHVRERILEDTMSAPIPTIAVFQPADIQILNQLHGSYLQDGGQARRFQPPALFTPAGPAPKSTLQRVLEMQPSPVLEVLKLQLEIQAHRSPDPNLQGDWVDFSVDLQQAIEAVLDEREQIHRGNLETYKRTTDRTQLLRWKGEVDAQLDEVQYRYQQAKKRAEDLAKAWMEARNFNPQSSRLFEKKLKEESLTSPAALQVYLAMKESQSLSEDTSRLYREREALKTALYGNWPITRKVGDFNAEKDIAGPGQSIYTDMHSRDFFDEVMAMDPYERRRLKEHLEQAHRQLRPIRRQRDRASGQDLEAKLNLVSLMSDLGYEPAEGWTHLLLGPNHPDEKTRFPTELILYEEDDWKRILETMGEDGRNTLRQQMVAFLQKDYQPRTIEALKKLDELYPQDTCKPSYPLDIHLALHEAWLKDRERAMDETYKNTEGSSQTRFIAAKQTGHGFDRLLGSRCGSLIDADQTSSDDSITVGMNQTEWAAYVRRFCGEADQSFRYSSLAMVCRSVSGTPNVFTQSDYGRKNFDFKAPAGHSLLHALHMDSVFKDFEPFARTLPEDQRRALEGWFGDQLDKLKKNRPNDFHTGNDQYWSYLRGLRLLQSISNGSDDREFGRFDALVEDRAALAAEVRKLEPGKLRHLYRYFQQQAALAEHRANESGQYDPNVRKPFETAQTLVLSDWIARRDADRMEHGQKPVFGWLTLGPKELGERFDSIEPPEVRYQLMDEMKVLRQDLLRHFGEDFSDAPKLRAMVDGPIVVMDQHIQQALDRNYHIAVTEQEVPIDQMGRTKRMWALDFSQVRLTPDIVAKDKFLCESLNRIQPGNQLPPPDKQKQILCQRLAGAAPEICATMERIHPPESPEDLCNLLKDPERRRSVQVGNWVIGPVTEDGKPFQIWSATDYYKHVKELSEQFRAALVGYMTNSAKAYNGLDGFWTMLKKSWNDPNYQTTEEKEMDKYFQSAREVVERFRKEFGASEEQMQSLYDGLQKALSQNGKNLQAQIEFIEGPVLYGGLFLAVALPIAAFAAPVAVLAGAGIMMSIDGALQFAEYMDGDRTEWNPVRTVFAGASGGVAAPVFVAVPELMVVAGTYGAVTHTGAAIENFSNDKPWQGVANLGVAAFSAWGAYQGGVLSAEAPPTFAGRFELGLPRVAQHFKAPEVSVTPEVAPVTRPVETPEVTVRPVEPVEPVVRAPEITTPEPTVRAPEVANVEPTVRAPETTVEPVRTPEPARVAETEPTRVAETEPTRVAETEPTRVAEPEPTRVAETEPTRAPETPSSGHETPVETPAEVAQAPQGPRSFRDRFLFEPMKNSLEWVKTNWMDPLEPVIFKPLETYVWKPLMTAGHDYLWEPVASRVGSAWNAAGEVLGPKWEAFAKWTEPVTGRVGEFFGGVKTRVWDPVAGKFTEAWGGAAKVYKWIPKPTRGQTTLAITVAGTATYLYLRYEMGDGTQYEVELPLIKEGEKYTMEPASLEKTKAAVESLHELMGDEEFGKLRAEVTEQIKSTSEQGESIPLMDEAQNVLLEDLFGEEAGETATP